MRVGCEKAGTSRRQALSSGGTTPLKPKEGLSGPPADKHLNTTLTYGYDNIYQLQTAKQGSTTKESYTYDIVGNRLSSLGVSPYQYNSSNELMSTPSVSYTYDNNGSVLTKSDGTQYTWDYENELTQVVLPGTGGTVNFKYDPFSRRIQKSFTQNGTTTTTDYLYDGANRIEDVDVNGNLLARYAQGTSIDEPLEEIASGTTSYYEQDGLGSVSSLSNSAGALANTYHLRFLRQTDRFHGDAHKSFPVHGAGTRSGDRCLLLQGKILRSERRALLERRPCTIRQRNN
jgi:YD repeat-containing protein